MSPVPNNYTARLLDIELREVVRLPLEKTGGQPVREIHIPHWKPSFGFSYGPPYPWKPVPNFRRRVFTLTESYDLGDGEILVYLENWDKSRQWDTTTKDDNPNTERFKND